MSVDVQVKKDKMKLGDPKRRKLNKLYIRYRKKKLLNSAHTMRCGVDIVEDWKLLDEILAPAICKPETRAQCIRRNVKLITKWKRKLFIAKEALRSSQQNHPDLPTYALESRVGINHQKMANRQVALKKCKDTICADVQKIIVSTKRPVPKKKSISCAPGYVFNGRSCKPYRPECEPITKDECIKNGMAKIKRIGPLVKKAEDKVLRARQEKRSK